MAKAERIDGRTRATGRKRPANDYALSGDVLDDMRWLRVADLAYVMGLRRQTIYNRISNAPETLPPITWIPGYRGPRWARSVVAEWQASHNPSSILDTPRRRGRPSKAEEIARRKIQAALERR